MRDCWQRANASGKERIAQERFAEIVRGVAERNDIRSEVTRNFVNGAAAVATAEIAAMPGLILQQPQRRTVLEVSPRDPAFLQIGTHRFDGAQKLTLFDGESTDG